MGAPLSSCRFIRRWVDCSHVFGLFGGKITSRAIMDIRGPAPNQTYGLRCPLGYAGLAGHGPTVVP